MSETPLQLIDIDQVLREKAPSKYRYIPRFVVNYLRHIVHEDELNQFIRSAHGLKGVDYLHAILRFLNVKIRLEGEKNLPPADAAPCIFACNHPLGAIDGVGVGAVLGDHYHGKIRYLVNDLLMNVEGLAPLCVPINKTGAQSRQLPRQISEGLASENHFIFFPAGLCSRRHGGVIRDPEWGKQFIVQSIKTHRDVVPLHFSGSNSGFFYRLANLRAALNLKINIEMMYLADEMMKNRGKEFTLTIGKPIPWATFDSSRTPKQWSQYVRDIVYKL
ncbi:MAG: glycerol acyltransferase [Bacteroidaceae bacterium]|jgi:putative hemolysin